MANIISLGSLYIDDQAVESGKPYTPGKKIGIGRSDSHPIQWVMVNGALIANRVLLTYVSWDDLDAHGFATGREIVLDGIRCFCRLLQVGDNDGVPNEWDAALAATNDDSDELWHYSNCAFGVLIHRRTNQKQREFCEAERNAPVNGTAKLPGIDIRTLDSGRPLSWSGTLSRWLSEPVLPFGARRASSLGLCLNALAMI